jgi:kynurenine formamidase
MALQGSTQWDGLAHLIRDDYLYNGWWAGEVTAAGGANRNGIQHQRETLVGRGVLLDVAGHLGRDWLESGYVVTPELLDEVASDQGVEVRSGDMLLVRTGYLGHWYDIEDFAEKHNGWFTTEPGLSWKCAQWCREKDVAALAVDNWAVDVVPFEEDAPRIFPFHQIAIPGLGMTLGEFWWLDDLAAHCRSDGRFDFFLAAQPLNVTNASGSMLNPLVIK